MEEREERASGTGFMRHAYGFGSGGGLERLEGESIVPALRAEELAWVHLDMNAAETRPWLERALRYLDPLVVEALLAEETRPRLTVIGEGALMILRGINRNAMEEPEDMVSLRMWVDSRGIISLQRRELKAVDDLADRLAGRRVACDAGEFLVQMITQLGEGMEPVLGALSEAMDDAEEAMLEQPEASMRVRMTDLRKRAILLRRYIAPQREALQQLRMADLPWLPVRYQRHVQENHDRLTRYVEDLDALRDRAQVVKDELSNSLADRLNRNTYLLSVVAAIFLPLGFVTGLLGINVGGIPGAESPYGFAIICSLLGTVVILQILWFKRRGWY